MATKKSKSVSAEFTQDRETKGTFRFREDEEDKANQVMGSAYLKKEAAAKLGNPESITITIESAD